MNIGFDRRDAHTLDSRTRSPLPIAFAHEVALTAEMHWLACDLYPGESYLLRALVEGGPDTGDKAALVHFDMSTWAAGGTGISVSRNLGPHTYLCTGSALHRTDRIFSVRDRVRRICLMAPGGSGPVLIKALTIERVNSLDRPADIFLSFDIEAAPERTTGDRIDQLVWGRIGGHEYGISRICRILEEHGLIGNFMIDFVTCAIRGEGALQEIIDHLLGRGHEVHMHLHPEYLDRSLGYVINGRPAQLDRTDFDMSKSLLELALESHTRFVGKGPYVFRAGGYRVNDHAVRAAGELGIHALTNVKPHTIADVASGGDEIANREPFVWDNGVVEIPVDASSPEVSHFKNYLERYKNAVARKPALPTFNVVMHSWSLTRRNSEGHHDSPAPEYEDRFHQICEHAAKYGRARGYAEYLESLPKELSVQRVAQIRVAQRPGQVTCNICGGLSEGPDIAGGDCPSCGLGVAHRQLRFALQQYGDIFAGRQIVGLDITSAESSAFLGKAPRIVRTRETENLPNESYEGVLWLGDARQPADIGHVMNVAARILKPGGVFAFPGHAGATAGEVETRDGEMPETALLSENGSAMLRTRHFIISQLPTIDPITTRTGTISLAYKPGGQVDLQIRPEWIFYLRSLRLRIPSVVRLGVEHVRGLGARYLPRRTKQILRKASALPGRGARLAARILKRVV